MSFEWTDELAVETPPFRGEGAPIRTAQVDGAKLLRPIITSLAPQHAPSYRPRESLVALATTGQRASFADEADAVMLLGTTGQKGPFKGQITTLTHAEAAKVV